MRVSIAIAAVALAGCEGAREGESRACFSYQDCEEGQTCFYGSCVSGGFGLTTVFAELTPPNDSPWLPQQVPHALDLDGFQEITLRASVPLTGSILAGDAVDSLTGVIRVRETGEGVPGRDIVRQANVSVDGFDINVLPRGQKALTFEPANPGQPPKDFSVWVGDQGRQQIYRYPEAAELAVYRGVVLQTDLTGTPSQGARVTAFGSNPAYPETEFRSTAGVTDVNGEFEIAFLPEIGQFDVRVGPNPGVNELLPVVTFQGFAAAGGADLGNLVLGIEQQQAVTAAVTDESGNAVRDANVRFEGSVGALDGVFVVEESSDAFGGVSASLLPGDYTVTVAPLKSQPYALVKEAATIPNGNLQITVQRKVRLAGCVVEHNSATPVPDAEITVRRINAPVPRVFRTATGTAGCYDLLVDPGTVVDEELAPAEYELTVQPEAETGLPFYRELMQVGRDPIVAHDINLYEPELVYGRVQDPNGMSLANVIIAFYSTELGPPDEPVLVGVVATLDGIRAGEFVLPVPVPPDTP